MARSPRRKLGRGLAEIKPTPPPIDFGVKYGGPESAEIVSPDFEPNPRAVPGDNRAPDQGVLDKLIGRRNELVAAASAWLNNFRLPEKPIDSEENAGKLKGFRSQVRALEEDLAAESTRLQLPHKQAIAGIKAAIEPQLAACGSIDGRLKPFLTDWLKREQAKLDEAARLKREAAAAEARLAEQLTIAAERQMAEDQAGSATNTMESIIAAEQAQRDAQAAAKVAERAGSMRAKVGGVFRRDGQKRSAFLATTWEFEITDPVKAAAAFCKLHPEGRPKALIEALEKIARHLHSQDRTLTFEGVKITSDQQARG